jgi:hypothetical protein
MNKNESNQKARTTRLIERNISALLNRQIKDKEQKAFEERLETEKRKRIDEAGI